MLGSRFPLSCGTAWARKSSLALNTKDRRTKPGAFVRIVKAAIADGVIGLGPNDRRLARAECLLRKTHCFMDCRCVNVDEISVSGMHA